MKLSITITIIALFLQTTVFAQTETAPQIYNHISDAEKYAAIINKKDLEDIVTTLCMPEFEGRRFGSAGNKKAAEYIVSELNKRNVPKSDGNRYEQFFKDDDKYGANIIGIVEGSVYPDESVIISCHYDGLGIVDNNLFPSADDNASGVAALIKIAEAFSAAARDGIRPKRSVIFVAFDAGKSDMHGSKIYLNHPVKPIRKAKILLNMDMLGRDDCGLRKNETNYVFLLTNNQFSSASRQIVDSINTAYTRLNLEYDFYKNNQVWILFYPTSDHIVFSYLLPLIFYTGGINADIHATTDVADKISYPTLRRRTQLIFYTAWDYANRDESL
jgi:Zn-dependent M28 family amino/carboxypeptidase